VDVVDFLRFPVHFLLGFSRSGTSLVMSYLRGHSQIETGYEEPNSLYRLLTAIRWSEEYEEELAVPIDVIKGIHDSAIGLHTTFYYKRLCDITKKKIAVLKHPWLNVYTRQLGEIFPQAHFIGLLRHPYDVIASTIDFRNSDRQAGLMFPEDLNKLMDLYWRHMRILWNARNVLKGRLIFVKFEEFIGAPGKVLGTMFKHYGARVGNEEISEVLAKASSGSLELTARVLMTPKLITPKNKWSKLSKDDQDRIRNYLSPALEKFGYEDK